MCKSEKAISQSTVDETSLLMYLEERAEIDRTGIVMTRHIDPERTEIERPAYRYDADCYLPDGPPGSEPGWWCPGGHKTYRDDCWMCRSTAQRRRSARQAKRLIREQANA